MKSLDAYQENKFAKFWIQESILFFQYKPNVIIGLEAAQLVLADRLAVQDGKPYPVLCDIRGIVSIDKAARDYLAKSGSVLTIAVGLLVSHTISVAITSFYVTINKPRVPTEIFSNESDALAFLKPYIL